MEPRELLFSEIQNSKVVTAPKQVYGDKWLAELPMVICGPILRKVHYQDVSVWLAFKEEVSKIDIKVFEEGKSGTTLLFGTAEPIRLGKHLFVSLVTALPVAATGLDVKLKPGTIYSYTISFTCKQGRKSLIDKGILKGGLKSITYGSFSGPTFCLPGSNLEKLKIVHGSCRKPHGGQTDALRALDTMLEIHSSNTAERPQLLCLTGDQIYADDVADALLHKIRQVENILLGWQEALPIAPKRYASGQLYPGNRTELIAKTGSKIPGGFLRSVLPRVGDNIKVALDDLTTTDSKSHLIFFSEFMLMYLFTYSDSFLSVDDWPKPEEVYHDLLHKKAETYSRKDISGSKYLAEKDRLEKIKQHRADRFAAEVKKLQGFAAALPYVKKALANVSTLMIFDDHDITDDWFMTKEWCEVALTQDSLSRRYIFNGLLAYTIFQDWGNRYDTYSSGKGLEIIQSLNLPKQDSLKNNYLNQINKKPNPFAARLESLILPELQPKKVGAINYFLLNKLDWEWHYTIKYDSICLIVLNTRTEREFLRSESPMGNLVRYGRAIQIGDPKLTQLPVIISAAPVFGNIEMEVAQEKLRKGELNKLTGLVSRWDGHYGMYENDQEAWPFSNVGFTGLLSSLSRFKRVLILSGDVHYAYTAYIRLWKKTGTGSHSFTQIVQSTSSALKNSSAQTHWPATNTHNLQPKTGSPYKMMKITAKSERRGFAPEQYPNPRFEDIRQYIGDFYLKNAVDLEISSDIQYTLQYMKRPSYNFTDELFEKIKKTAQKTRYPDYRNDDLVHDVVVGKDNISLLSFSKDSITNTIWFASAGSASRKQNLYEDHKLIFPFAVHKVVFDDATTASEMPVNELSKMKKIKMKVIKK